MQPQDHVLIVGLPEKDIEDVQLDNIKIYYKGGGTKEQAAINLPEDETGYPEPDNFGDTPAYGFFIRHVKNIKMSNIEVKYMQEDIRPPFILDDVKSAEFNFVNAEKENGVSSFKLNNVEELEIFKCELVKDTTIDRINIGEL